MTYTEQKIIEYIMALKCEIARLEGERDSLKRVVSAPQARNPEAAAKADLGPVSAPCSLLVETIIDRVLWVDANTRDPGAAGWSRLSRWRARLIVCETLSLVGKLFNNQQVEERRAAEAAQPSETAR